MRVTLVIDSLALGGAERHVVDLARALRDRGDEVCVACSAPGPLRRDLDEAGIRVHCLGDVPPTRVLVAGGGPLRERLEAQARATGVAGQVTFPPRARR